MRAEAEVRRRIQERGRITFAEFMDLALFWPDGGYYTDPQRSDPRHDFYTAPGAHPAFGALICLQVYQIWRLLECPEPFWVVEMGSGGGLLCHDLVSFSRHLPGRFRHSLRYLCLDIHSSGGVRGSLDPEDRGRVERLMTRSVPLREVMGCFISNELLDSFPVHRVTVDGGELREVYVSMEGDRLVEAPGEPSTPLLHERLDSEGVQLAEGYSAEISLAVGPWMSAVSAALAKGYVLTVDYGYPARELYARPRGTLSCFHNHVQTEDPLRRVGEQDITAHVDFTAVVGAGQERGLEPLGLVTQREFLQNLGLGEMMSGLRRMGLSQREADGNRMGMLDIARPGGMGDFKVLAQGRGVGGAELWGFSPSPDVRALLEGAPVPLRSPEHLPLMEGRYPHLGFDLESLYP